MIVTRPDLLEAARRAYGDRECNCHDCLGVVVDAVLPLIAQAIEALEWAWHFRGPGDPGIEIVAREAALDAVRGLMEGADG